VINLEDMRKKGQLIKLKGREYTTHEGLLAAAHEHGLEGIAVEMVSWDPDARAAVMRATAKGSRGTYTDYGDASPMNVGKMIANACIRMASTRASSRALRLYLGVGMTCYEELPGRDHEEPPTKPKEKAAQGTKNWGTVRAAGRNGLFDSECKKLDLEPELGAWMVKKMSGKWPDELEVPRLNKAVDWLKSLDKEELGRWHADFLDLGGE
jgi:hypothetical protein